MARIRTVDDKSRRDPRLALIAGIQAEGMSLLAAATNDSLKTRIRLALLDLENAVYWLNQDAIELRQEVLQVVDDTIVDATRNMAIVAKALDDLRSHRTR